MGRAFSLQKKIQKLGRIHINLALTLFRLVLLTTERLLLVSAIFETRNKRFWEE
jgi:hypothetical protein